MKQKAIIIDLDGTLADCEHRRCFIAGTKKDWKSFSKDENIIQDKLNLWCATIINKFKDSHKILLVTGRMESSRKITIEWLNKFDIKYDLLLTRKDNDFRKDSVIKEELYKNFIEPHFDVLFCLDDRKQVVDTWRSLGLICLQCADGEF
ncbi:phosphatase domain-containing protein (plasmid) [Pigmentibacter ruber]